MKNKKVKKMKNKNKKIEADEQQPLHSIDEHPVKKIDSEDQWQKVQSDVFRPEEGDIIEGLYIEKEESKKFEGNYVYHIHQNNRDNATIVFGTTVLDRLMQNVHIGSEVRITRLSDKSSDKGNPLKMFEVHVKKKVSDEYESE